MTAVRTYDPTMLRVAVVLDDPETDVSTDDLFVVVSDDGYIAIGPAASIGDVAEWVFDAAADSFEAAYDLVLRGVLRRLGTERGTTDRPPEGVQVFMWAAGETPPEEYVAWNAARRGGEFE